MGVGTRHVKWSVPWKWSYVAKWMRDNVAGIDRCKISTVCTQSIIYNSVQNCKFFKDVITKE